MAVKIFTDMATVYSTLAASTALKPITPHVAGFRARNAAPSLFEGQRLVLKRAFQGEQVSKRSVSERRNRCVCAPRASLDEYAPLTAAVYGACLLGGGLFACNYFSNLHFSCITRSWNLQSTPSYLIIFLLSLFMVQALRTLLSHVLHCCPSAMMFFYHIDNLKKKGN